LNICLDSWVEVFLPPVDKWICINPVTGVVNSVEDIIDHATQPMSYVVGVANGYLNTGLCCCVLQLCIVYVDGSVKDLSARYMTDWMTGARRRRVNDNWWKETLLPFKTKHKEDDQKEDSLIQASLEKLPFPMSIGDYKNHPLYALNRHLLKFEAIYPEVEPLGFFKGEAIYPRECVRTLHSRETWLKYARMVKRGEQPFKMVKQRPKRNEPQHLRDQLRLEVFGEWQTEEYKPDPVKDGKVPRNAYGNIELFQPSMLPGGAVHIQVPNIQKIARKLGIDHAPAMVGWDFHGGFSHPLLDGIVVAKEFEQTLLDAWEEQQEELERKAAQKREKEVMDRWRKLIKGMLIHDRLRRKYDFQDDGNEFADSEGGSGMDKVSAIVSKHDSCSEEVDVVGHLTLPPVVH
jgi:xeroderma pigmentosum group C-complementing protein